MPINYRGRESGRERERVGGQGKLHISLNAELVGSEEHLLGQFQLQLHRKFSLLIHCALFSSFSEHKLN